MSWEALKMGTIACVVHFTILLLLLLLLLWHRAASVAVWKILRFYSVVVLYATGQCGMLSDFLVMSSIIWLSHFIYIQRLSTTGAVNDRICIVSKERWRFRMRMTMNLCFSFAHHRIFSVCVQRQWDDTLWVHNGGTRIFDSWETEHARMLEKRFVLILIFSYSRQIWFSYAEWKFDLPGKRWERIFDYFVVLKGEEILFFFSF